MERRPGPDGRPGGRRPAGPSRRAPRDGAVVGATCPAGRGRPADRPASVAGDLRAWAVDGRPGRGRRGVRAGTTHGAAPRPLGHASPARAEGWRARRTGAARSRHAAARRDRGRSAGDRERVRGRASRPGDERRPRLRLAAHRRLRRLAGRLDLGALGRPRTSLAGQPAARLSCRWPHRRQAGERALT